MDNPFNTVVMWHSSRWSTVSKGNLRDSNHALLRLARTNRLVVPPPTPKILTTDIVVCVVMRPVVAIGKYFYFGTVTCQIGWLIVIVVSVRSARRRLLFLTSVSPRLSGSAINSKLCRKHAFTSKFRCPSATVDPVVASRSAMFVSAIIDVLRGLPLHTLLLRRGIASTDFHFGRLIVAEMQCRVVNTSNSHRHEVHFTELCDLDHSCCVSRLETNSPRVETDSAL